MKEDRISVRNALVYGDVYTKLSVVLMGAGLLFHGQITQGILVLLVEIAFWFDFCQNVNQEQGNHIARYNEDIINCIFL